MSKKVLVRGKEMLGQNASENLNQSKGEMKFKTLLLLTNYSPVHLSPLFGKKQVSKPAPPVNLSGSDTPSVAQVMTH